MKAIQVRYLETTNTKGTRLKAFTDAGSIIEPRAYDLNFDEQALRLAKRYIKEKGWQSKITGQGGLPNGDEVFTIS